MNYPALILKAKRERSILFRHPWVFSGAVQKAPIAGDGDIISIQDIQGKILGFGFYSPKSQIVCRMFHFGPQEDFSSLEYWMGKIQRASQLRKSLLPPNTNCYRLLHAEGDFIPGIIADVYDRVVVVQILVKGTEKLKDLLVKALNECGFPTVYLKTKSSSQNIEEVGLKSGFLSGTSETPVLALENNVKFEVDFVDGQKTGFFLDQRDNRDLLGRLSKGKTVLNTFCYTGGFSIYALAAGAKEVVSVDISKDAVELCNQNVALNKFPGEHKGVVADCFDYLKEMPSDFYDVIVLDPPAFAKNARAVDNASRGYKQINLRAIQKIKPGGILFTFSCSQNIDKLLFQKIVFGAASDAGRNVRILDQLHQPFDHPINIFHPEGEYLKGLVVQVE